MASADSFETIYAETFAVFDRGDHSGEPLTTPEVATELDCSRRATYKRLKKLVDRGDLRTKKVGSRARVWWYPIAAPTGHHAEEDGGAEHEADEEHGTRGHGSEERTKATASDRKFRAVFEEAFDAMLITDDDAAYVDVNPAACELFGLSREDLLGRTVQEFAAEDYDFDRAWQAFQASDRDRGIFPLVRSDGEHRLVEFAATPDVLPGRHLSIIRDVTEREEREHELRQQRDELRRLDHLNTVLRGIDQAITRAERRREAEELVCRTLVSSGYYRCVGIGEFTPTGNRFESKVIAGEDSGLFEAIAEQGERVDIDGSTTTTVITTEGTRTVQKTGESPYLPWRESLRERGFRSLAMVPVVHQEIDYGMLVIVSDRADVFDEKERDVLDELGEKVGHAINALERERALIDEELVAVTLRSRTLVGPFGGMDGDSGTITLNQTIPLDGEVIEYLTVEGIATETFVDFCERSSMWSDVRLLKRTTDRGWFEVRTSQPTIATLAARFGGRARSVEFDGDEVLVTIETPRGTNVRRLVSALSDTYPGLEFVGQERVHRRDVTQQEILTTFEEHLTRRQRNTLRLAFYAGYYELPRETSGEQLAERIGIHPSTFHDHLRRAERKLLAALFDGQNAIRENTT